MYEGIIMINRERMAYIFILFLILWFSGVTLAAVLLDEAKWAQIGLATAGGVFLGAFKDMWQFLWRKAAAGEDVNKQINNNEGSK
jgi:hypothetical protein